MLVRMFNRFLLLLLLAHCLFVAQWLHFGPITADATIVVVQHERSSQGRGRLLVKHSETNETFTDRIAAFGPRLTEEGLEGHLVSIDSLERDNSQACRKLKEPIVGKGQIILVERGNCSFIQKVRNMQESRAIAVVVGDPQFKQLITMYSTDNTSDVKIPSVFVGYESYVKMRKMALNEKSPIIIRLMKDDLLAPLLDIIIVVILSPTIMMVFLYVLWRIRQRQRRRQDMAPEAVVFNLPTKTYYELKRQENDPQDCAICLEDYVDGDKLRIMPCKHEFHVSCIDSWLTTRKKFCPICKRDICLATEETPLLSSSSEPVP